MTPLCPVCNAPVRGYKKKSRTVRKTCSEECRTIHKKRQLCSLMNSRGFRYGRGDMAQAIEQMTGNLNGK